MVDGNLEIHYHLPQNSLRLFHIDIKQMLLILQVQRSSRISDSIQTVLQGICQCTQARKEDFLRYYSLNQARQRRKSDLSWQDGKSIPVFYPKQKGLAGRNELYLNKLKFFQM